MANERQHSRIDTALDAVSDALSDSKPTSPTAGSAETNWQVGPGGNRSGPESAKPKVNLLATTAARPGKDSPLEKLGRYRLEKVLGRGGMGVVWLGYDPQLNRRVAIKTIRPDIHLGDDVLAMFLDEGRRLASLNHASIIPVYDCGNEEGICYLVSEYVSQGTLADYLKRESLTHQQAAELVSRVAEAAHYAHLRGLVHRDIKPANILMREDGKPLLADFGLAIAEEEQLGEAPGTLGTYAYMAPEQMLGESRFVDGRADIYSLGVVLYQLLTGRMPYLATTRDEYRALVLGRDPRPPRSVREDIPIELEAICLKCLARQPGERYSTAADLAAALRKPIAGKVFNKRWLWAGGAAALIGVALITAQWLPDLLSLAGPSPNDHSASGAVDDDTGGPSAASPVEEPPSASPPQLDQLLKVSEVTLAAKSTTQWGLKDQGESLWFLSDDLCLLELGDYQEGDLKFSIEIEQKSWVGGIGLFWAHRACPDKPGWRQLEQLQLKQVVGKPFQLHDSIFKFSETASHWSDEMEIAFHSIDSLAGQTHRIGFEFKQGVLIRLQWDSVDLSKMLSARAGQPVAQEPSFGTFGLVNRRSHGNYSRPIFDGRRIWLAAADATEGNP